MTILEKEVWVGLSNNAKYYENLGYDIPKHVDNYGKLKLNLGDKIKVKVSDLSMSSTAKVTKICDRCGIHIKNQKFGNVLNRRDSEGKDYCETCGKIKSHEKRKNNLPYAKCLWSTHPDVAKLLKYPEHGYHLTYGSNIKEDFICDSCHCIISNKYVYQIVNSGLSCPKCSDGVSYPEKIMLNLLEQIQVSFEYQKSNFNWLQNKRYDFYLPDYNTIIEINGEQHYNGSFERIGGRSLNQEQENDNLKKRLAKENRIKHYITIDARYSELEYIKNSIMNSELSNILRLNYINWDKCNEFATKSMIKTACELWNKGIKDLKEIGNNLNLDRHTICKYLKQGFAIGLCNYDPNKALTERSIRNNYKRRKPVIQLTLHGEYIEEWEGTSVASEKLQISRTSITNACNKKIKSAGGFRWEYKSFYEDNKESIENSKIEYTYSSKKVVQLDLYGNFIKEYSSLTEASEITGINLKSISKVCIKKNKSAGKYVWMFKDEYESFDAESLNLNVKRINKNEPVLQLDKNTMKIIKIFNSVKEATIVTNICHISTVCRGERKLAGGYKWMYKEDYDKLIHNKEAI